MCQVRYYMKKKKKNNKKTKCFFGCIEFRCFFFRFLFKLTFFIFYLFPCELGGILLGWLLFLLNGMIMKVRSQSCIVCVVSETR